MNAADRIKHMNQVRQLYGPNLGTLTENLIPMGESLHDACIALADDCTVIRIDGLVSRLKTAEQTLSHLRRALIAERTTGHGTG